TSLTQIPTDLRTTTPALFLTRWITHICAPTFVFLSGTSAYISFSRMKNIRSSRNFLLTRGLWLILLEFTVVNFGLWFDIHFQVLLFDVIAAIGFGFIVLSLLLNLSARTIGIIGLIIIFSHDIFLLIPFSENSIVKMILMPFFGPGVMPLSATRNFVMGYPPIPWLGIMLTGFGAGSLFELPSTNRKKIFSMIGIASLVLFIVLRMINIYGDPIPWKQEKNVLYTILSFVNVTKYPPSLLFCLLMLGFTFLLLRITEQSENLISKIAIVYGRVPLFYFIVHFYIIHLLTFLMVFLQGFKSSDLVFGFNFGRPAAGSGVNLAAIYLNWIGVVIILFPLCQWYGRCKLNHPDKLWLRYL
ncbi:MAG TPA: heparan-alpha-glucosaminide N-acetyltransferase domain-containing protein, partial [Puia sp.]|nr:heparan-alpha-glucosaminide N-acetyltransferase domain-containing protein [Puia sp.]